MRYIITEKQFNLLKESELYSDNWIKRRFDPINLKQCIFDEMDQMDDESSICEYDVDEYVREVIMRSVVNAITVDEEMFLSMSHGDTTLEDKLFNLCYKLFKDDIIKDYNDNCS